MQIGEICIQVIELEKLPDEPHKVEKTLRKMLVFFKVCCILCIKSNFDPLLSKPTARATSLTLRSCKIQTKQTHCCNANTTVNGNNAYARY